jgi:LacI family transcriptional regulator
MPRVTIRQIAAATGCSKSTVASALSGQPRVLKATRDRILRVAEQMGYQPDPALSHFMAGLRTSRTPNFVATLALVNAHRDPEAFWNHPTIPSYVTGCQRRAEERGYRFDRFWLHDPAQTARSWLRIFQARAIRGIVLVGLMDNNRLPEHLAPLWKALPCVVTGVRTSEPTLPFACVDHHHLALDALQRALDLGYKRPALVVDEVIDRLVDWRFTAGFHAGQQNLPRGSRVPAFTRIEEVRKSLRAFQRWLKTHRPDVICTLYNSVFHWLEQSGYQVPRDIGVIQLEWRAERPEIAGMNQHNDVVGEAAVDMLISRIRNQANGVPAFPSATLIGATWMDGTTVGPQ